MRISMATLIMAALAFGTPAFVQAQGAPSQSETQTPPPAQSSTMIRSIQVVDVKELQPAVRARRSMKSWRTPARMIFNRFESRLTRHRRRHRCSRPRA